MNVEHINKQTKLLDILHKVFIVISAVIAPLPTVLPSYGARPKSKDLGIF